MSIVDGEPSDILCTLAELADMMLKHLKNRPDEPLTALEIRERKELIDLLKAKGFTFPIEEEKNIVQST